MLYDYFNIFSSDTDEYLGCVRLAKGDAFITNAFQKAVEYAKTTLGRNDNLFATLASEYAYDATPIESYRVTTR
jgi:hypothetical protein